jgi:predicted ATPase
MSINFARIDEIKKKINSIDLSQYTGDQESYKYRVTKLQIEKFRHINRSEILFSKPISIITAKNKVGKTSLLLLIACSHERFMRIDSTTPTSDLREHSWKDVLRFTSHENTTDNYEYKLSWRFANKQEQTGTGKRIATTKKWSGIAKKSADYRTNAKIKNQEVRYIDLERVTPARNFSESLYRKVFTGPKIRVSSDIEECFSYIVQIAPCCIYKIGSHINKTCYLVESGIATYSSYNAATGEDNLISLLIDLIDSPQNTVVLIDEIDAGLHPEFQRRLADVIYMISWLHKKQFIITTHSPSLISAFGKDCRMMISINSTGQLKTQYSISKEYAIACMDSEIFPLIRIYCEDDISEFIIRRHLYQYQKSRENISKVFEIIKCGPGNKVVDCFTAHKHIYDKIKVKQGYCAFFDGDFFDKPPYRELVDADPTHCIFLFEGERPEKYLVSKYLIQNPHQELNATLLLEDHHPLFSKMVELGLSPDVNGAKATCYNCFEHDTDYSNEKIKIETFFTTLLQIYEN